MKFRTTVVFEYHIPDDKVEDYYGTTDPVEAAKVDQTSFDNDVGNLIESITSHANYTVKVEVVK